MHHPICYYIPAHMLGHINLARARGLAEPGPEQQTARVSEAFRQRRRQALVNFNPTPPNPTPPPSRLTRMPPQSGGRSHSAAATRGSSALAAAVSPAALTIPVAGAHARLIYDDQNQWAFMSSTFAMRTTPPSRTKCEPGIRRARRHLEFYREVLGRNSIDNLGINLDANVNYGVSFNNTFSDATRMVFGNGDNVIFQDFTNDVDVPGHELTHGVTQFTAGLLYSDQPGALNEATSDIFGACIDVASATKTLVHSTG